MCENGPIASEDEASSKEDLESDGKESLETVSNEEQAAFLKKVIWMIKWNWDKRFDPAPVLPLDALCDFGWFT